MNNRHRPSTYNDSAEEELWVPPPPPLFRGVIIGLAPRRHQEPDFAAHILFFRSLYNRLLGFTRFDRKPEYTEMNRDERESSHKKYMEYSKKIESVSPQQRPAPSSIVFMATSLFDMLPVSIIQDVILSFVGPSCQKCGRKVGIPDPILSPKAEESSSTPPRDHHHAIYLEEVTRKHNIHAPKQKRHWILDDHKKQNLILAHHSKSSFPIEKLVGKVDLEEVGDQENVFQKRNPPGGPVYREKDEDELLGPFRSCVRKRPVRSFLNYLTSNKARIFCPCCARTRQEEHFEEEFARIHAARTASIEAWITKQLERGSRHYPNKHRRLERNTPNHYHGYCHQANKALPRQQRRHNSRNHRLQEFPGR
jgi:hypothetical protein